MARWNRPSRMARRNSGARSTLTLPAALDQTRVAHAGHGTSIVVNSAIVAASASTSELRLAEVFEPGHGRVLALEFAAEVCGVEFGEPFARGTELVAGDALGAFGERVAVPPLAVE